MSARTIISRTFPAFLLAVVLCTVFHAEALAVLDPHYLATRECAREKARKARNQCADSFVEFERIRQKKTLEWRDFPVQNRKKILGDLNDNDRLLFFRSAASEGMDELYLAGALLEKSDLEKLSRMSGLHSLDLTACNILTNDDLKLLPPNLKCLNLSFADHLTDDCLKHLPPALEELDLSWCPGFSLTALDFLPAGLHALTFQASFEFHDDTLLLLPQKLTHLELGPCSKVTDAGLFHLSGRPLKTLRLQGWVPSADDSLKLLPQTLEDLTINGQDRLTDAGLLHLKDMPITHLDLRGSYGLTDDGIWALRDLPLKYLRLTLTGRLTFPVFSRINTYGLRKGRDPLTFLFNEQNM